MDNLRFSSISPEGSLTEKKVRSTQLSPFDLDVPQLEGKPSFTVMKELEPINENAPVSQQHDRTNKNSIQSPSVGSEAALTESRL